MACHGKGCHGVSAAARLLCACAGMIDLRRMLRVALALLPFGTVFSDVMEQSGLTAMLCRAESGGKLGGSLSYVFNVFLQRLKRSVFPAVGDIFHRKAPLLKSG